MIGRLRASAPRLDNWLAARKRDAGPHLLRTPHGDFNVRRAGRGPSIVFACDAPNVTAHYDALFAALEGAGRLTAFDLLGSGRSIPAPNFDHGFDAQVASIIALLERLEGGPHTLVFPCVTGLVAHAVGRRRPELVAGLVLTQTPTWARLLTWVDRLDPRGWLRTPWLGQSLVAAQRPRIIRGWYRAALGPDTSRESFARVACDPHHGCRSFSLASMLQAWSRDAPPFEPLASIPALVVWGTADRTHRGTDRGQTLSLVPGARLVELDGVGHSPELEDPERFARAFGDWWSSTR